MEDFRRKKKKKQQQSAFQNHRFREQVWEAPSAAPFLRADVLKKGERTVQAPSVSKLGAVGLSPGSRTPATPAEGAVPSTPRPGASPRGALLHPPRCSAKEESGQTTRSPSHEKMLMCGQGPGHGEAASSVHSPPRSGSAKPFC